MIDNTLNEEQLAWLALASAVHIATGKWLRALQESNLSAVALVRTYYNKKVSPKIPTALVQAISLPFIKQAVEWQGASSEHYIITYGCKTYPSLLKTLSNPPLVLFVLGNPNIISSHQIAIVGSRSASHQGKRTATEFAQMLSTKGITVTSGLALGIDAAAHAGGVAICGRTIAVMGTGPDLVYPARNEALHKKIIESGGACITEFFPGVPVKAWHFPRRNRIIAAISLGTLVVEAKIKSGTLITANLAADMGREVFAIPGSIFHPYSQGCHWLIQQGAKLVTNIDDIFEEISVQPNECIDVSESFSKKSEANSLATDKILDSVDYDVTTIDVITQRSHLPIQTVMVILLEYELRGLVATVPGGYVKLRGK